MTSTATPVSATTEQEHQYNDNQKQFHGISPLMPNGIICRVANYSTASPKYCSRSTCNLPDLRCGDVSNFARSSSDFR